MVEASPLELVDLAEGDVGHLLLAAELDRPRRAALDAGRLQRRRHPVDAQRALVDLLGLLVEAGDVEGAARHAVLAADALRLVEVHDAVGVLDDGSRCRAGGQAAGVVAVEAAVLADEPGEVAAVELDLLEPHEVPGRGREVLVALVAAEVGGVLGRKVVPLLAGHLAGLAADAEVDVDELGDLDGVAPDARRRRRRGRLPADGQSEFG